MKTNKLAVYGTLRNGKRDTWKVDGYLLVFPGHRDFPAAMIDSNAKGAIVEVIDVDVGDMIGYDRYENVKSGLYERRIVNAYKPNGDEVEAWMYTVGPALLQYNGVFEVLPNQDWFSEECVSLRK